MLKVCVRGAEAELLIQVWDLCFPIANVPRDMCDLVSYLDFVIAATLIM